MIRSQKAAPQGAAFFVARSHANPGADDDEFDFIGAEVGATRAVVQAGWAEAERQVGQTGKTVRPKLYIAAGISGAIQHRVGMESSDVIVAINTDPNAPIFDFAHYGIVGNAMQVLPVLTQAFRTHLDKRICKVA